jgi:hypothetical protein
MMKQLNFPEDAVAFGSILFEEPVIVVWVWLFDDVRIPVLRNAADYLIDSVLLNKYSI